MNNFNFTNFFANPGLYSSFFESTQNVWEVLPKIEEYINNFRNNLPDGFSQIDGDVFVGRNVEIDKSAKIEGMAIISHNSSIGHSAYLRRHVLIGENVHIGHAVEVKQSIILDNSAIAHLNYIGDSIVGSGVNIGGGAILANWRFDKKNVRVHVNEENVDTGMEKLGGIVGDGCGVGANSVLNPGTVIGKNSFVFPLVSVSGFHPAGSRIKE